jgi:hypothetical protein
MPPATPCAGCGEDQCPSPRFGNKPNCSEMSLRYVIPFRFRMNMAAQLNSLMHLNEDELLDVFEIARRRSARDQPERVRPDHRLIRWVPSTANAGLSGSSPAQ